MFPLLILPFYTTYNMNNMNIFKARLQKFTQNAATGLWSATLYSGESSIK